MEQKIAQLFSRIENALDETTYTFTDSEYLIRKELVKFLTEQNALVASARHIEPEAVVDTIIASVISTNYDEADPSMWLRQAASIVIDFNDLAFSNDISAESGKFTSLLPVGHPRATRVFPLAASAYRRAFAEWVAADPRLDETSSKLIFEVYSNEDMDELDSKFLHLKINSLVASGAMPEELTPMVAAFNMSSAMRSAMSKAIAAIRRRDRGGKFANEYGRLKGWFSGSDGKVFSATHRIVGPGKAGTNNYQVEADGSDPRVPKGIYEMDASNSENIDAYISKGALKRLMKGKKNKAAEYVSPKDLKNAVSLENFLATRQNTPNGWTSVKGKNGQIGFKNDQGLYAFRASRKEAEGLKNPGIVSGTGENDALDADNPSYFLLKDKDGKQLGVAQDWAGIQEIGILNGEMPTPPTGPKGVPTKFKSPDGTLPTPPKLDGSKPVKPPTDVSGKPTPPTGPKGVPTKFKSPDGTLPTPPKLGDKKIGDMPRPKDDRVIIPGPTTPPTGPDDKSRPKPPVNIEIGQGPIDGKEIFYLRSELESKKALDEIQETIDVSKEKNEGTEWTSPDGRVKIVLNVDEKDGRPWTDATVELDGKEVAVVKNPFSADQFPAEVDRVYPNRKPGDQFYDEVVRNLDKEKKAPFRPLVEKPDANVPTPALRGLEDTIDSQKAAKSDEISKLSPSGLADGYAFSPDGNGRWVADGATADGSNIAVTEGKDGKWTVSEEGGTGPDNYTEKDLDKFDSAQEAFEYANNQKASPIEFDADAAKDSNSGDVSMARDVRTPTGKIDRSKLSGSDSRKFAEDLDELDAAIAENDRAKVAKLTERLALDDAMAPETWEAILGARDVLSANKLKVENAIYNGDMAELESILDDPNFAGMRDRVQDAIDSMGDVSMDRDVAEAKPLSPAMQEPATPKQYALLQEYLDERALEPATAAAIEDALANKNLQKHQVNAILGIAKASDFKEGVDPTKPSQRMLDSLQGYLQNKDLRPTEIQEVLDSLTGDSSRDNVDALLNKLRRKKDKPVEMNKSVGLMQRNSNGDYSWDDGNNFVEAWSKDGQWLVNYTNPDLNDRGGQTQHEERFSSEQEALDFANKLVAEDQKDSGFERAADNNGSSADYLASKSTGTMADPASDKQYGLLDSLLDSKQIDDPEMVGAIREALQGRNLTKAQMGSLLGPLLKMSDKPSAGKRQPTTKQIDSIKRAIQERDVTPDEFYDIKEKLDKGMSFDEASELLNDLKSRPITQIGNLLNVLEDDQNLPELEYLLTKPEYAEFKDDIAESIDKVKSELGDVSMSRDTKSSDASSGSYVDDMSDPENWTGEGSVYVSPDGRLELSLEGDVDGNYISATFDGEDIDLNQDDVDELRLLLEEIYGIGNGMRGVSRKDNLKAVSAIIDDHLNKALPDRNSPEGIESSLAVLKERMDAMEKRYEGELERNDSRGGGNPEGTQRVRALIEQRRDAEREKYNQNISLLEQQRGSQGPDLNQDAGTGSYVDDMSDIDNWTGSSTSYVSPDGRLELSLEGEVDGNYIRAVFDGEDLDLNQDDVDDIREMLEQIYSMADGERGVSPKANLKAVSAIIDDHLNGALPDRNSPEGIETAMAVLNTNLNARLRQLDNQAIRLERGTGGSPEGRQSLLDDIKKSKEAEQKDYDRKVALLNQGGSSKPGRVTDYLDSLSDPNSWADWDGYPEYVSPDGRLEIRVEGDVDGNSLSANLDGNDIDLDPDSKTNILRILEENNMKSFRDPRISDKDRKQAAEDIANEIREAIAFEQDVSMSRDVNTPTGEDASRSVSRDDSANKIADDIDANALESYSPISGEELKGYLAEFDGTDSGQFAFEVVSEIYNMSNFVKDPDLKQRIRDLAARLDEEGADRFGVAQGARMDGEDWIDLDDVRNTLEQERELYFETDTDTIARRLDEDGYYGDARSNGAEARVSENDDGTYTASVTYDRPPNDEETFDDRDEAIAWAANYVSDYNRDVIPSSYQEERENTMDLDQEASDSKTDEEAAAFADRLDGIADDIENNRGDENAANSIRKYGERIRDLIASRDARNQADAPSDPMNSETLDDMGTDPDLKKA